MQGRSTCREIERQFFKALGVFTTGRLDKGGRQASQDPGCTQNLCKLMPTQSSTQSAPSSHMEDGPGFQVFSQVS